MSGTQHNTLAFTQNFKKSFCHFRAYFPEFYQPHEHKSVLKTSSTALMNQYVLDPKVLSDLKNFHLLKSWLSSSVLLTVFLEIVLYLFIVLYLPKLFLIAEFGVYCNLASVTDLNDCLNTELFCKCTFVMFRSLI